MVKSSLLRHHIMIEHTIWNNAIWNNVNLCEICKTFTIHQPHMIKIISDESHDDIDPFSSAPIHHNVILCLPEQKAREVKVCAPPSECFRRAAVGKVWRCPASGRWRLEAGHRSGRGGQLLPASGPELVTAGLYINLARPPHPRSASTPAGEGKRSSGIWTAMEPELLCF